ncbi:MAG: 2OG-Fe(II) oxygenase [Caulobacteraceae bacterium]
MTFLSEMDGPTGFVSPRFEAAKGAELCEAYRAAQPFPHVVIDDFLPAETLEMCLAEFPSKKGEADVTFDRPQERLKTQFNPDTFGPPTRTLFYSFNSRPFIGVLENITGIKGLIPDPYFLGAGFHEIQQGGHLSVHTDFNHHKPMDVERRINVLIYLNKGWKSEYGGQLELWNRDMSACVERVVPEFNRCVIFNTTDSSYHGNPNPVSHPTGVSRKSIALYYYTATWSAATREHTTQFRGRPGAGDKTDWTVRARETVADWTPPILGRALRGARRRLRG